MGLKNALMPGIPGKTSFTPTPQNVLGGGGGAAPPAATAAATGAAPAADHIWSQPTGWGENYEPPRDLSLPTGWGESYQPGLTAPPQATGSGDNWEPARPTFTAPADNPAAGMGAAPAPAAPSAPSPIGGGMTGIGGDGGTGWLGKIKGAKSQPPPAMQQPTPTPPVQRAQMPVGQPWAPPKMVNPTSSLGAGGPPQQMTGPPPWARQGMGGGFRPGGSPQFGPPQFGGGQPGGQRMQMLMQMMRQRGQGGSQVGPPGPPAGAPGAMPGQPGGV